MQDGDGIEGTVLGVVRKPYLDYNLSFPKPGIPMDMDGGVFEDTRRIEVVWREVVRHPY